MRISPTDKRRITDAIRRVENTPVGDRPTARRNMSEVNSGFWARIKTHEGGGKYTIDRFQSKGDSLQWMQDVAEICCAREVSGDRVHIGTKVRVYWGGTDSNGDDVLWFHRELAPPYMVPAKITADCGGGAYEWTAGRWAADGTFDDTAVSMHGTCSGPLGDVEKGPAHERNGSPDIPVGTLVMLSPERIVNTSQVDELHYVFDRWAGLTQNVTVFGEMSVGSDIDGNPQVEQTKSTFEYTDGLLISITDEAPNTIPLVGTEVVTDIRLASGWIQKEVKTVYTLGGSGTASWVNAIDTTTCDELSA